MDIYPYFNSKDIAEHLRRAGRELDAAGKAYVIYLNESMTLERKLAAFEEIVRTEPDCELREYSNTTYWASTREFLRAYANLQRKKLDLFGKQSCLFYLRASRYSKGRERMAGDCPWADGSHEVFSSVDRCVDYIRCEYRADEDDADEDGGPSFDRFEIGCLRVDQPDDPRTNAARLVLDDGLEVLSVDVGGLAEGERDVDGLLADWFLALPVPFRRGDVVVDVTNPTASPFVFDRLKFWDSKELTAHGVPVGPADAERIDRGIARRNERGSWDCSHMPAMGYELAAESDNPIQHHGCAYYDVYGACDNYLNLERYRGRLEGERRLLGIISEYARGDLGIEAFLNFSQLISLDAHASRLRRSYDRDYVEEARELYGGQSTEEKSSKPE